MSIKIKSSGGGDVTLDVGSTASSYTATLPSATTTLVGTDTTQTLTNKTLTTPTINTPTITAANITWTDSKLTYNASGATLANSRNDNVTIPTTNTGMITFGGGGVSCQIGGMVAPADGTKVAIWNNTGQAITILFNDANSTAANRIYTPGGASVTWNNLGIREFVYFSAVGRWILIGGSST